MLLRLRATRFRHLLESYGSFLALLEDAAEKQGGAFILDMQYVVALSEQLAELADTIVFDLNVITCQQHLACYDVAEWLRAQLRSLVAQGPGAPTRAAGEAPTAQEPPRVSPAALAAALSRSRVLYAQSGHVACRGVAAGSVFNLGEGADLAAVPEGSVLVAGDVSPQDAVILTAARRAGALLLDRGSAAGAAARLARELRIPAVIGLGTATARLASGTEVTVDADENVVYLGRIPELVEYYRSAQSRTDEVEEEYRLLRLIRQAAFPLSFLADQAQPALSGCRTVHDLAHLARSLAGDTLSELVSSERFERGTQVRLQGAPWCEVRVIGFEPPQPAPAGVDPTSLPSRPLRAFLEGLASHPMATEDGPAPETSSIRVAVTDEHVLAVSAAPHGSDLLDATAGAGREGNGIYCRFAPRGQDDPAAARGALAAGVLTRLGFAVALTAREASGWIRGLPSAETEERVRIAGSLVARLGQLGARGWRRASPQAKLEAFIRTCA
jgi:pyruvate,water dikinase